MFIPSYKIAKICSVLLMTSWKCFKMMTAHFPFNFEVALGILTFLSYFELQILFGSSQ